MSSSTSLESACLEVDKETVKSAEEALTSHWTPKSLDSVNIAPGCVCTVCLGKYLSHLCGKTFS